VCIFAFWWGVSVLTQGSSTTTASFSNTAPGGAAPLTIIESHTGNTYTYSGAYTTHACQSLGSGIALAGGGGKVTILLTTAPSTFDCAQAAGDTMPEAFSVSVIHKGAAPEFEGVMLNGQPLPATLAAY